MTNYCPMFIIPTISKVSEKKIILKTPVSNTPSLKTLIFINVYQLNNNLLIIYHLNLVSDLEQAPNMFY